MSDFALKLKERKIQMKFAKNKTMATLILMLIMAIPLVSLSVGNAATVTNTIHTYLYVGTSAGGGGVATVGRGQSMLITAWTKDLPPDVGETAHLVSSPSGQFATYRAGWDGVQVNITKPDNTTLILDFSHSDPVGNNYMTYTPDQVGTYYIQAIFPATWKNSTNPTNSYEAGYPNLAATFYSAAVSRIETFTVTSEPTPLFPESPLPQDYWTRPISGASRTWYVLTGNKLGGAAQVWPIGSSGGNVGSYYYGQAPESAHILWSKPYSIGGIMDVRYGDTTYETTHYQGTSFSTSIILDGKIYWSPRYTNEQNQGLEVIDLYTGNTLYLNYTDTVPSMASIYNYQSPNQMGGYAYLWNTGGGGGGLFGGAGTSVKLPQIIDVPNATEDANCNMIKIGNDYTINTTQTPVSTGTIWQMLDGWTRNPIAYIANVSSSGTQVYGQDGSILYYNIVNKGTNANPSYYCTVWNSSAGTMVAAPAGTGYWQFRPAAGQFGAANTYFSTSSAIPNAVHNGNCFYSQNFSIPSILGSNPSYENGTIQCIRQDNFMIVGTQGWNNGTVIKGWMEGISLAQNSSRGQKLWEMTYTPPFADPALNVSKPAMFTGGLGLTGVYPEDGVLTWADPQTCERWVYDLYTGNLLWTSPPEAQYEYYGISQLVYNHQLIGYGNYAGQLISYDIRTGKQLWNYTATNVGFESPYGNYPMSIAAVADGKIYTVTSEHHNIQPMYRGENLRCINATNGQEIWKILCFGSGVSIADGILVKGNCLDNMIYAFGKGPSATTVTVSQDISVLGSKVMIKGAVTDQTTSGRINTNGDTDFTLKDTPAISDASMSAWMEYKYMQQAFPSNATGVPVTLDTIDPNGNFKHIGDVTSDMTGNYALPFKPEVPGTYQIIATFAGSKAYGSSFAQTYMNVGEAAPTASSYPVVNLPPTETYFAISTVAIIIAIAIIGVLILRKKP